MANEIRIGLIIDGLSDFKAGLDDASKGIKGFVEDSARALESYRAGLSGVAQADFSSPAISQIDDIREGFIRLGSGIEDTARIAGGVEFASNWISQTSAISQAWVDVMNNILKARQEAALIEARSGLGIGGMEGEGVSGMLIPTENRSGGRYSRRGSSDRSSSPSRTSTGTQTKEKTELDMLGEAYDLAEAKLSNLTEGSLEYIAALNTQVIPAEQRYRDALAKSIEAIESGNTQVPQEERVSRLKELYSKMGSLDMEYKQKQHAERLAWDNLSRGDDINLYQGREDAYIQHLNRMQDYLDSAYLKKEISDDEYFKRSEKISKDRDKLEEDRQKKKQAYEARVNDSLIKGTQASGEMLYALALRDKKRQGEVLKQAALNAADMLIPKAILLTGSAFPFPANLPMMAAVGTLLYALRARIASIGAAAEGGVFTKPQAIVVGEAGTEIVIPFKALNRADTMGGANPLTSITNLLNSRTGASNSTINLSPQIHVLNPIGGAEKTLAHAMEQSAEYLIPVLERMGFKRGI